MAEIRVNPTRMELKKLQQRYQTARRGHKLLKDKRDELVRRFLDVVRRSRALREEVDKALCRAYGSFALASAVMQKEMLVESLMLPRATRELTVDYRNQMNVTVPDFSLSESTSEQSSYNYGLAFTSGELDAAVAELGSVRDSMLQMAGLEKEAQLLAEEIERTRRRVNALEHIMMPRYLAAIRSIKMKLDENERGNITRLMKVKDMMLAAQLQDKHEFFPDEEEHA